MRDKIINNCVSGIMKGDNKGILIIGSNKYPEFDMIKKGDIKALDQLIKRIEEYDNDGISKSDKHKCLGILEELKENIEDKAKDDYEETFKRWNKLKEKLSEKTLNIIETIADGITIGTFLVTLFS